MSSRVELALLWEPENLEKNTGYISFLSIVTNGKITTYRKTEISLSSVKNLRSGFSSTYNQFLETFSKEVIRGKLGAAELIIKQSLGDEGVKRMVADQIRKYTYGQVERFTQVHHLLRLYQWEVNPETHNKRLVPAEILKNQVKLSFELQKRGSRYYAEPYVQLLGRKQALSELQRYGFVIGTGSQWHLLKLKDYKTLSWLSEMQANEQNLHIDSFQEKILSRLELDYKVVKRGHFKIEDINEPPVCSIQLSELNDSFLVFMPQWRYAQIMVDGNYEAAVEKVHNGVHYRIHRDQAVEEQFFNTVKALHPSFAAQARRGFFYLPFAEARKRQWFVKAYRNLLESNVLITGLDKLSHFKYSPHEPRTEMLLISSKGPSVVLDLRVYFGKEEVPAITIQKTLLSGQHTVLLKDDSIAVFPEEWQEEYGMYIKHAEIKNTRLHLPAWLFWEVKNKNENTQEIASRLLPEAWRAAWHQWQNDDQIVYEVPSSIQATLRPYQQKGYEWLVLLSEMQAGACLADDMGLGKTLQTICFLARQWEIHPGERSIVICPASLLHNWEQEMSKYLPSRKPYIYSGAGRDWQGFLEGDYDLLIASYGTVRQDIEILCTQRWQVAIIDESHNIKNTQASITRAVGMIRAVNKIALSGTPVMNNTFDLYAQLDFALPGLLGSKSFFNNEYVIPIDRDQDEAKMRELRAITSPFILRRTKNQVAKDLPDRTESTLWCEMNEAQRYFYEEAKLSIRNSIFLDIQNNGLGKARFGIIQGLLRLRQICNAPQLLKDGEGDRCKESIKIDYLIEKLRAIKEEGAKALVFSQFTGMLSLIADRCREEEIDFYHFDGSTPAQVRHQLVSQFQSEQDEKVAFLISLKAGNAGLNLTAAQYVFLVDPWWNNAVEQQAIDRTHRIGQAAHVFAYRMICKDSIEEKILAIQQKKKILSEELITAEEGFVKQITEDELQYLFS